MARSRDASGAFNPRTGNRKRNGARYAALVVMALVFVVTPFLLARSIIFVEPAQAVGVLLMIGLVVLMLLPLHNRAVNTKPWFWGLMAVFILHILWPRFLSVNLPFLPLLSPIRIVLAVVLGAWVLLMATSAEVHDELWRRLKNVPVFSLGLVTLLLFLAISIPFSVAVESSFQNLFEQQLVDVYLVFFAAVSLIRTRANIEFLLRTVVVLAVVVSLLLIVERATQLNPFTTYLGGLVNSSAGWLRWALENSYRNVHGAYRAKATFLIPLDAAEFLVLALPFVFYWFESAKERWVRWVLLAAVPLMLVGVYATDSRTSIMVFVVICVLYGAAHLVFAQRQDKAPNFRPLLALVLVSILLGGLAVAALLLRHLDWQTAFGAGGSRMVQFELALPRIRARPFIGYGVGQAAMVLNYVFNGRDRSIDSYILSIVLDGGIPALLGYFAMMGALVVGAWRRASEFPEERKLMLAYALFGIAFFVGRITLSTVENLGVVYALMGSYVVAMRLTSGAPGSVPAEDPDTARRVGRRRRSIVGTGRWRRQVQLR